MTDAETMRILTSEYDRSEAEFQDADRQLDEAWENAENARLAYDKAETALTDLVKGAGKKGIRFDGCLFIPQSMSTYILTVQESDLMAVGTDTPDAATVNAYVSCQSDHIRAKLTLEDVRGVRYDARRYAERAERELVAAMKTRKLTSIATDRRTYHLTPDNTIRVVDKQEVTT